MTLEAIGQKLKAARESQGLSLRQIYERTKIPTNHLQAIDSGHPDDLPEPVYVAGFIKRYAETLGLDAQALADEYRLDTSNGDARPKARPMPTPVYVTPNYLKHTKIDRSPPTFKLLPFYALGVVVIVGFLNWSMSHASLPTPDPAVLTLKQTSAATPAVAAVPGTPGAVAQPGQPAAPPTIATAPVDDKVTLSITRHVWVEVKKCKSNETIFRGFMEKGQTREFQDPQGVEIRAGEGSNLSVEYRGKIEPFGAPGKVAVRTFVTQQALATNTVGSGAATGNSILPVAGASASSSSAWASRPKKVVRKMADGNAAVASAPHRRRLDGGYRSIGEEGARSIEVPYRYSEGRLDAN